MILIQPGDQPKTTYGRSIVTYSGHVMHMLPADQQYELPSFTTVIVYNGHSHFSPCFLANKADLQEWRVSLISKHIAASIDLFDNIEGDLVDEALPSAFQDLRDSLFVVDSLIGNEKLKKKKNLPTLVLGSTKHQKRFPHARKVDLRNPPTPHVVLQLPPNIVNPPTEEDQTPTENVITATKSVRGAAPKVTESLYGSDPPGRKFFPCEYNTNKCVRYKNVLFAGNRE